MSTDNSFAALPPGEDRRRRCLAGGLVAIALGLGAVSALGPLGTGLVVYRMTDTLRNQTVGLDAVSLFVVAPLCLYAAWLVLRRSPAGAALALAVGAYTAYMFVQYIVWPEYGRFAGNNERAFPLDLALFAAGWAVALAGWNSLDVTAVPSSLRRDRRLGRVVLPALAFLAFVRYVPALADAMSSTPTDRGYLAGRSFFWAIAMLDIGVFLPATVATCVGLVRRRPWAQRGLYLVVGWFGLVGPAVAAMAIAMYVNDDPMASVGSAIFMTAWVRSSRPSPSRSTVRSLPAA
jgi:hypothetical protein